MDDLVEEMRRIIEDAGLDFELVFSTSVDHCDRLIADGLDRGVQALWIGGGDGTLNHVLNCTHGRDVIFGVVPMGTINALAQSVGIPCDAVAAVRYLLKAKPVDVDIGQLNQNGRSTYFFTYATVGIHAAVFHNIDTNLKRRWGKLAFWESALRTVWRKSQLPRLLTEMELAEGNDCPPGTVVRDYGYSFTLSNMANYTAFSSFTDESPAAPGFFELHSFRRNKIMPMLRWLARVRLFGRDEARPEEGVHIRNITRMTVRSNHRLSVQVDGEPVRPKSRQLEFVCVPSGAKLLLRSADAQNLTEGKAGQ